MDERKPNAPAEFSVQSQAISDEQLENVAGGTTVPIIKEYFQTQKNSFSEKPDGSLIPPEDTLIFPNVARTYF